MYEYVHVTNTLARPIWRHAGPSRPSPRFWTDPAFPFLQFGQLAKVCRAKFSGLSSRIHLEQILKVCSSFHNWLRGATVARLTPDQKAACSNHVGVIKFLSLSYLKKKIFVLITNKHSVWCVTAVIIQKYICLQWGLNSWPLVYKTNALPLSYRGFHGYKCKSSENLNAAVMWMILLPGTYVMYGSMV